MNTAAPSRLVPLVLLTLLILGCGREAADPAQGQAPIAVAATHAVTDAADRVVEVPIAPQRVVVLSELDLDTLLALGLKPVGATDGRGSNRPPAYLGPRVEGVQSVGNFAQPSVDRIVVLQPDLIIAGGHPDPQLLEQLQQLAPTVISFKPGESWQDSLGRIAMMVGRADAATQVLADYQRRADALREQLKAHAGETVSIVRLSPNGPMYMLGDAFAGRVLDDLGFARPPAQQAPGAGHAPPLSREVLADIDGDWLFIGNFTPDPEGVNALRDEPAFAELRAARHQQVREVDAMQWTVIGGPLAAHAVLDDIEAAMLKPRVAPPA
ncbi:MAG: iron-siderophore ABC transporter substrate-binding protein [Pseudomonadota bacterium]|nr:iron-siderophore ABC transporter substrate-binding protein [Pseudomonadota bacterium]